MLIDDALIEATVPENERLIAKLLFFVILPPEVFELSLEPLPCPKAIAGIVKNSKKITNLRFNFIFSVLLFLLSFGQTRFFFRF
jgi:hypothetical protein